MAINPSHPEIAQWAAWAYMSEGQAETAVGILESALRRRPGQYVAASWLQQAYEMLGRGDDHRRALTMSIEAAIEELRRHPENVHARSVLASQLVQTGDHDRGVAQIERAVAMAPHDGRIRYNAACVYARLEQKDKALAELREGIRNLPSYIADWPRRDPDMALLHDDPEFIRLFGKAESARGT